MSVTSYHKKKNMPEPTVQTEPPAVIPPTPITEETSPRKTEEKTDDAAPPDTATSGNGPLFINPCQGGPNPFENAPPTEIEDHPVDEFIEEGDNCLLFARVTVGGRLSLQLFPHEKAKM